MSIENGKKSIQPLGNLFHENIFSVGFGCQKPLMQSGRISNDRNPVSLSLVASIESLKVQCVEMHDANDKYYIIMFMC